MSAAQIPTDPAPRRPRSLRQQPREELERAKSLRPRDVFRLHNVPVPTVHRWCKEPDPNQRLPHVRIEGTKGRRGLFLINHTVMDLWIEWHAWKTRCRDEGDQAAMQTREFASFPAWRERRTEELARVAKGAVSRLLDEAKTALKHAEDALKSAGSVRRDSAA